MPSNRSGAVGVFDSGLGGISVLREIRAVLPCEDLAYVADTAYCPYGGRPYDVIRERAEAIARFLIEQQGVKALVAACNTATVAAIEHLRSTFQIPIVGMEPGVKPAVVASRTGVVGVLATGATLAGERFNQLVERFAGETNVLTQPCPGLVERVEAGALNDEETRALLRGYLRPLLERGADTIVLGCTHYPFLRPTVEALVPAGTRIIDTGAAVARQTARVLAAQDLLQTHSRPGRERFYTTADPLLVQPVLEQLWGSAASVAQLAV